MSSPSLPPTTGTFSEAPANSQSAESCSSTSTNLLDAFSQEQLLTALAASLKGGGRREADLREKLAELEAQNGKQRKTMDKWIADTWAMRKKFEGELDAERQKVVEKEGQIAALEAKAKESAQKLEILDSVGQRFHDVSDLCKAFKEHQLEVKVLKETIAGLEMSMNSCGTTASGDLGNAAAGSGARDSSNAAAPRARVLATVTAGPSPLMVDAKIIEMEQHVQERDLEIRRLTEENRRIKKQHGEVQAKFDRVLAAAGVAQGAADSLSVVSSSSWDAASMNSLNLDAIAARGDVKLQLTERARRDSIGARAARERPFGGPQVTGAETGTHASASRV